MNSEVNTSFFNIRRGMNIREVSATDQSIQVYEEEIMDLANEAAIAAESARVDAEFARRVGGYYRTQFGGIHLWVPEGWVIKERLTNHLFSTFPEWKMTAVVIGPKFEGYMPIPIVGPLINLVSGKTQTYLLPCRQFCDVGEQDLIPKMPDWNVNWQLISITSGYVAFGDAIKPPDKWWLDPNFPLWQDASTAYVAGGYGTLKGTYFY